MTRPLPLPDVALLVSMVNPGGRSGRAWGSKSRMILALGQFVDGGWFNAPDVEALTGIPRNRARELLADLEAQKVILRDGGPAARPKVFWCEVNPEWRRWDVEWSAEPRQIEMRLARVRELRALQPFERLNSRWLGPRFAQRIAVLGHRANERVALDHEPFSRWLDTAIPDPRSRQLPPRKRGWYAKEVSLLTPEAEEVSSSLAKAQEEEGMSHQRWGMVCSVYARKVGAKAVWGAPKAQLARLLAEHGPDRLIEAIDQAPDELGVGLLAPELARRLELTPDDAAEEAAVATPAEDVLAALRARKNLEQLVATIRADGGEPAEELLAELARWQYGAGALEEA